MARGNRGKMLFETDDDHHSNSWINSSGPRDDLGDPDSDSLTTLTEYLNGSNPRNRNSDGDSKNDAAEIAQGSDPANAADSGAAPTDPPEPVPFHLYGDYTAWEATLKGKGPHDTRTRRFRMSAPNVAADQTLPLLRGNAYELSLRYIRTKPGESVPWYCWETTIGGKSTSAFPLANHWVVDNRSALLAPHTHSHGTNLVADKKVNLLPVDLDIVHPATGELSDAKEDVDDGGYVSVQRLENLADATSDVTPKTKVKIHAISGAQSTWKTRLKFNGADRYKIYRDEARTQEVVSEQTEFDATQDTTLFFHGLKKSLARGGELVTMQVKVNDAWVDGDSLKCTIVQSEFLIQVKAFIPYAWTEAEEEVPGPNGWSPMEGKVAKGDLHPGLGDRTTSPGFLNVYSTDKVLPPGPVAPGTSTEGLFKYAPFRCCQTIILTPYKDLHSSYDLQSKRKHMTAPSSDHYVKATSVNAAEIALKKGYMGLSGGTSATGKGPITTIDYRQGARSGKVAELHVEFGGKDGALGSLLGIPYSWGAADIHWYMWLKINSEADPILPTIEFGGNHDRYPAYEIIVIQSDGTYKPVHNVLPAASALPGPNSLADSNAMSVGRSDTIRD
ncbi:MAG: hypothetical protein RLZZ398_1956 [Verrucomicrobiota bacterium]